MFVAHCSKKLQSYIKIDLRALVCRLSVVFLFSVIAGHGEAVGPG
jgi:hypothetical protein